MTGVPRTHVYMYIIISPHFVLHRRRRRRSNLSDSLSGRIYARTRHSQRQAASQATTTAMHAIPAKSLREILSGESYTCVNNQTGMTDAPPHSLPHQHEKKGRTESLLCGWCCRCRSLMNEYDWMGSSLRPLFPSTAAAAWPKPTPNGS